MVSIIGYFYHINYNINLMKPTDYNNEYEIEENNRELDIENDYEVIRVEEEYDTADPYNFYPDGSF